MTDKWLLSIRFPIVFEYTTTSPFLIFIFEPLWKIFSIVNLVEMIFHGWFRLDDFLTFWARSTIHKSRNLWVREKISELFVNFQLSFLGFWFPINNYTLWQWWTQWLMITCIGSFILINLWTVFWGGLQQLFWLFCRCNGQIFQIFLKKLNI